MLSNARFTKRSSRNSKSELRPSPSTKHSANVGRYARHARRTPTGLRLSHLSTWQSWRAMKGRCLTPSTYRYEEYGGRGISIHPSWMEFSNFLSDMGPRPEGTSLDRINGNGNYEPGNCRWATPLEQVLNTKQIRWIEFNGERMPMKHWAERVGLPPVVLRKRLLSGWPLERALNPRRARSKWERIKSALPPSPTHSTEERAL